MTFQQLRYFLALCQEENFTRAAKRCGVAQPSLTRAIRELEAEFGGSLFVRNGRTSNVSKLGEIVRPYLVKIDRAAADAKREGAAFLTADLALPFKPHSLQPYKPKESTMRKVVYGVAAAVTVLLIAGVAIRPPQPADASPPAETSGTIDVYAIEATIDINALPRQDIPSEAYE